MPNTTANFNQPWPLTNLNLNRCQVPRQVRLPPGRRRELPPEHPLGDVIHLPHVPAVRIEEGLRLAAAPRPGLAHEGRGMLATCHRLVANPAHEQHTPRSRKLWGKGGDLLGRPVCPLDALGVAV